MAYITIVKGDDTDFLDNQYLVVNFNTEIDLAGFQAIFKLGSIELLYPDLSAKYIEIILSKEVTNALPKGKLYGTLQLVDKENRVRTITTVLPFNVITKVLYTSQISKQSIQLDVKVQQNEISVDMNILGLSKTVAESYLNQMKLSNSQMAEKVQSIKLLENNISNLANSVADNLDLAEKWATASGLVNGEDYSAKYYALQSKKELQSLIDNTNSSMGAILTESQNLLEQAETVAEEAKDIVADRANRSLSNLDEIGEKHFLNKSQISNCLLEVPQRVKYELVDGVLTIKQGSQVVVPYGLTNQNYTVVGSPTIVDGIVSGLSSANYLTGKTGITLGNNFAIDCEFVTCTDVVSYQGLLRLQSASGYLASISNRSGSSSLVFGFIGQGRDVTIITEMKSNTFYRILIKCEDGLLKTYCSENNANLVQVDEVSDINLTETSTVMFIGNNTNANYWQGSIDLKQFSITVDDEVVYRPYIQKGDRFLNAKFKVADTGYSDGKFFVWAELQADSSKNMSIIGADISNVYIHLLDGNTDFYIKTNGVSGTTQPTGINGLVWFDTTNNLCKRYYNNVWENSVCSLPVAIANLKANYGFNNISQVFNGIGYIGSTIWMDKGIKGLIPNGRNDDGTLKNIEFETTSLITGASDLTQALVPVWYGNDNTLLFSSDLTYVDATNRVNSGAYCQIATVDLTAGVISNFRAKQAFQVVDNSATPRIMETYQNGTSWYRVWSDGWCEQGGLATQASGDVTITLLKPYKDLNYIISHTAQAIASNDYVKIGSSNISVSGFTAYWNGDEKSSKSIYWHTMGYIA